MSTTRRAISIHALREEGDGRALSSSSEAMYFYPRPPRGGRRFPFRRLRQYNPISIHALREEGDKAQFRFLMFFAIFLSTPSARRATWRSCCSVWRTGYFYPRPPRGGRLRQHANAYADDVISIHALREEGDSKNGEKHLRFCFIIKRSAQIWKSFSKNIRKNSCNLHRTA